MNVSSIQEHGEAVKQTLANLFEVKVPVKASSALERPPIVAAEAPPFAHSVVAPIMAGKGDSLPVSAFPVDGTHRTGTWEIGYAPPLLDG
jgi:pyruvate-ferredoxin/flavodoxin oxidoreductase